MNSTKATPEEQAANIAALNELRKMFPTLKEDECADWLMNCTPFPFATISYCVDKAKDLAIRSNGDPVLAMQLASDDMDNSVAELDKDWVCELDHLVE